MLFRGLIPSTPELVKAYGTRASEIAKSNTANPRGDDKSHGVFASTIGADVTTLWAAATSGRAAIACHLLTCMLARIWEPPEAVSIWVEIISARKEEVKRKLLDEGEVEQELLAAVGQKFDRSDLRDWDASVRAWLRVADTVMVSQQTQLRLILDNLDLPINTKPDTYDSVIQAWTSAMLQTEKLLKGTPLRLQGGDICLGLLSWHLYPDMIHVSTESKTIKQNDPILKGRGVLTIGLQKPESKDNEGRQSIYWSLPLAHLRYYGLPVSRLRSMSTTERDRITMDEFLLVATCAYMKTWDGGVIPNEIVIQYFINVATLLSRHVANAVHSPLKSDGSELPQPKATTVAATSWLSLLAETSRKYFHRLKEERIRKLRNIGLTYCKLSISSPFQDIFSVSGFLKAAYSLEEKINLLREVADTLKDASSEKEYEFIIAYNFNIRNATARFVTLEYATALPEFSITKTEGIRPQKVYRRWITTREHSGGTKISESGVLAEEDQDQLSEELWKAVRKRAEELRVNGEVVSVLSSSAPSIPAFKTNLGRPADRDVVTIQAENNSRRSREHEQRPVPKLEPQVTIVFSSTKEETYSLIYGDVAEVGLLQRRKKRTQPSRIAIHQSGRSTLVSGHQPLYAMTIEKIMELFVTSKVDFKKLAMELNVDAGRDASLLGLCFAANLYRGLEGATIDVRATQFALHTAHWIVSAIKTVVAKEEQASDQWPSSRSWKRDTILASPSVTVRPLLSMGPEDVNHAVCFACIATFETGTFNLHPDQLSNVFAFSSGDSLYIASALLRDPAFCPKQTGVQRFTGNIGRAGVAFLVPPVAPMIKEYGIEEWYQYNRTEFDGVLDDCFSSTSLHLSFSEALMPIDVGYSGGRDIEAYLLEALVSVYDRDIHIGELDVLKSFASYRFITEDLSLEECDCNSKTRNTHSIAKDPTQQASLIKFASIDSFAEIIEPPSLPGIIRARGNWQAKLSAASLCLAKGYKVVLGRERTCMKCLTAIYREAKRRTAKSNISKDTEVIMIL